ncbi:MAG: sulfurtransferase [Hyphomicrobiaceae bacterium]
MTRALISPTELSALLTDPTIVIIDTRDPESYAAGHIPGAVNIHEIFTYLATSTPDGMTELTQKFADAFAAAGLSGTETAVIYEQSMNTGFGQSCRGYFLLKHLGYEKVSVLHGGYQAWQAEGHAADTEVPAVKSATFPVDLAGGSLMSDVEEVKAALVDPSVVLLDVRDVDEWIGESSSPYGKDFCPRKGRLQGAVWVEWYRMMKPGQDAPMFKSKEELLAEFATVGITPTSKVIVYCFKGARASNTFLALQEAGVSDVKIYFGSWNEWSRDPSLPIEEGYPYQMADTVAAE